MRPFSCDGSAAKNLAPPMANPASRQQSRQASPSNVGIRSRNKRLGPMEVELVSSSATSMAGGSRAVSPVAKRNISHGKDNIKRLNNGGERCDNDPKGIGPFSSTKSLWDSSWASHGLNTLQEIAFSMMTGPDDPEMMRKKSYKNEDWFGKGKEKGKGKLHTWGPDARVLPENEIMIGVGSSECRENKLKEKKKARMLESRDETIDSVEQARIYKHRTSLEEAKSHYSEEDGFTLVYVHNVLPQDTIQGVVLKYHSQMDVFKKANRLWTGDSIQIRDRVFLPVDACAIKGKPCPAPQPNKSSQSESPIPTPYEDNNDDPRKDERSLNNNGSYKTLEDNENNWTHVRWVLFDSMPSTPVEVVRIPQKTLKYFPPRRRKSFASVSSSSNPRISSDIPSLLRFSIDSQTSSVSQRASMADHSLLKASSVSTSSLRLPLSGRGESVSETADRLGWLRGPGGVGTLGKNVRKPGPAKDVLNSWTSKKFPNIAIDSLPSTSAVSSESAILQVKSEEIGPKAIQGFSAPVSSGNFNDGMLFPNVNISGVENWVRKLATNFQVPRISREDAIEMLNGAGSDDLRNHETATSQSSHTTSRLRKKEDSIETSARGRIKSGKSE